MNGKAHGFGIFVYSTSPLIWIGYFIAGRKYGYFTSIGMIMDKDDRIKSEPTLPYISYGRYKKDKNQGITKLYTKKSEIIIDYETPKHGFFMEKDLVRKEIRFWRFEDSVNNFKGFGFDWS